MPVGPATQITAGSQHTCALLETREVFCWGSNSLGQSGPGKEEAAAYPVFSGLTHGVSVGAGGGHTCAILSNGKTQCLGPIQAPRVLE